MMNRVLFIVCLSGTLFLQLSGNSQAAEVSVETEECLGCHATLHPGIVEGWKKSRHAQITPGEAMKVKGLALKVSSKDVPKELQNVVLGCAECHTLRPDKHKDTFDHNGYEIHSIVSPDDCATCHAVEADQYSRNIMAWAYVNFVDNPVYQDLEKSILGKPTLVRGSIKRANPDRLTQEEACLYCHGTKLEVTGTETRDSDFGEMEFPVIKGWPNQGTGRINLDGSKGSCSACHTRHQFSIEEARKPHTCKECHVGPDVPAYKVYTASKHGTIYSSHKEKMNFTDVPWTIGEDFRAPTCATCHVSLLVNTDGDVVAERTHEVSNRLSWRLFGLIYAHPQPKDPNTSIIKNRDGLPLPTNFDGTFADSYLISPKEQERNRNEMKKVCLSCHDSSWVEGHYARLDNTIATTNHSTKIATQILGEAWSKGYASGLSKKQSPFDEYIERTWSETWLLYSNTIRFAAAMAGGGDYGVFANGRYELSKTIATMEDWLKQEKRIRLR